MDELEATGLGGQLAEDALGVDEGTGERRRTAVDAAVFRLQLLVVELAGLGGGERHGARIALQIAQVDAGALGQHVAPLGPRIRLLVVEVGRATRRLQQPMTDPPLRLAVGGGLDDGRRVLRERAMGQSDAGDVEIGPLEHVGRRE